jgi:2-polyprenyl-6-methoxyphenol hydroxylase-like FAD-dependent oxidoreductase
MRYDLVVVGGGIAGATLARVVASAGLKVLVLEREVEFRDRVRGEQMHCWGVAEARALGIHDLLRNGLGYEVRLWSGRIAGLRRRRPATSSRPRPIVFLPSTSITPQCRPCC